jgi:hypothetical protein
MDLEKAHVQREKATRKLLGAVIILAFMCLFILCGPSNLLRLPGATILVYGVLSVIVILISLGGQRLDSLANDLRDEAITQRGNAACAQKERDAVLKQCENIRDFVQAYRIQPTQEQVDVMLREAALKIRSAYKGMDKGTVSIAEDQFWRIWNLADECRYLTRGPRYKLKKAWQPYADVPWKEPEPQPPNNDPTDFA